MPWRLASAPTRPGRIPERRARADGFLRVAGVDEAGRGPWAGPVVAAAVVLRPTRRLIHVDDSKRLRPAQRTAACKAILQCAEVGVGIASADEIDRLNILQASLLAMVRAVQDLSTAPDLLLVDGTHAPSVQMPSRTLIGGDRTSASIACASIVAKVLRDDLMVFYDDLYPGYEFRRHKGYGTPRHAALLQWLGPSRLHRMTFRPVRDVGKAGIELAAPVAAVGSALADAQA